MKFKMFSLNSDIVNIFKCVSMNDCAVVFLSGKMVFKVCETLFKH